MALLGRKKSTDVTEGDELPEEQPPMRAPDVSQRTVAAQRDFLFEAVGALRPFAMQIHDVVGLTLCEDITADLDLPLVTTASVGGYGVRAADLVGATPATPVGLYVVGSIAVGDAAAVALVAGAAIEVEAGAILPSGVDAIVPSEYGEVGADGHVYLSMEVRLYENLRKAGSDMADGTPLLSAGDVLSPRSVGVLAEVGIDKVLVRPQPRIVVLSVTDVLVAPGDPLTRPHQRYEAATALLSAAARAAGATVYPVGLLPADPVLVRQTIADQQIRADLIVVVGGEDQVDQIVGSSAAVDHAEVALNGRAPYAFAEFGEDRTPVIFIPSGSVNVYAAFHAFIRPLINQLNEVDLQATMELIDGRLGADVNAAPDVTYYLPAYCSDEGIVDPVSGPDSQMAWDLERADVLAVIPAGAPAGAGTAVQCIALRHQDSGTGSRQ
ncbi:MAG: gephyrin-like molybdotransferase Glp [Propioniciclava sp.]